MTTTEDRLVTSELVAGQTWTPVELDAVVSMLVTRFPGHPREEVASVVGEVYRGLVSNAKVTAHLIPLTFNRSREQLARQRPAA